MDKWVEEYTKDHKDIEINYQGTGSKAGIQAVIDKANDFGCTDAFLKNDDLAKAQAAGGDLIHVPLVMGAIVPAYNLPSINAPLRFDGQVLGNIFMGKITKWDDPAIAALNQGVNLPDLPIAVVHRADGSGSTFIFSSYLTFTNDGWKGERGASTTIDWKGVGTGENGTAGVAGAISKSEGAIGYVELTYALQNKVQYGAVKNKEGEFILGSTKSVTAAAEGFLQAKKMREDLRYNLADAPGTGPTRFPAPPGPSSSSSRTAPPARTSPTSSSGSSPMVRSIARIMHYAPLPEGLSTLAVEKVDLVK